MPAVRAPRRATGSSRCPVLEGHSGQEAFILGQAPGIVEARGASALARAGRADAPALAGHGRGGVLRDVLLRLRDALLPGTRRREAAATGLRRRASRSSARSGANGSSGSLRPRLDRGGRRAGHPQLLGLTSLDACVGERFEYGDAVAVPLPHPSGVSRWMNLPENQRRVERAVELVHRASCAPCPNEVPPTSSPRRAYRGNRHAWVTRLRRKRDSLLPGDEGHAAVLERQRLTVLAVRAPPR